MTRVLGDIIKKEELNMSENLKPNVPNENSVLEEKTIIGIVSNCSKLNVREKPTKASEVKCVLNEGTEVIIDIERSTDTWYYVTIPSGIEGYCMKQFIAAE